MQHLQKLIVDSIQNSQFPNQPANLYDPIRYFLSLGGKRIRPTLTLLAAEMFGIREITDALPAANRSSTSIIFHLYMMMSWIRHRYVGGNRPCTKNGI